MSYLVLARKWRPKKFAELVGQTHVVKALTNALETGRVHHAFLFTGTRGVGKTTIARIFAKSLNCEQGTGAEPCGACSTCQDIDAGRYFDMVEIDAASNTGVDDVRELIESAQYMPSRGKFKVFLIDEVHMLSKNAFNALLKTLEEPPEHVKFLLATTDPQKLPVTVLSRCLQFNLMRLDEEQIAGQIRYILGQENITAEDGAIALVARGADGSLRDGLSLLDQAIAFCGNDLKTEQLEQMLGTIDRTRVAQLLTALVNGDGKQLMQEVQSLAEFSPDWHAVLDAMSEAFHKIQLMQLVDDAVAPIDGVDVQAIAQATRPEVVQLWYQMALNAQRDLNFAPTPRAGFEMAVLRMLAFKPGIPSGAVEAPARLTSVAANPSMATAVDSAPTAASVPTSAPVTVTAPAPVPAPAPERAPEPAPAAPLQSASDWATVVKIMPATGAVRHFAEMLHWIERDGSDLYFEIEQANVHLNDPDAVKSLERSLAAVGFADHAVHVEMREQVTQSNSVVMTKLKEEEERMQNARDAFLNDPDVKSLLSDPDTTVVMDSIRPQ